MSVSARLACAYVETAFQIPTYAKNIAKVKKMDALMNLMQPAVGPYLEHPNFVARAQGFIKEIYEYKGDTKNLTINFGDSLVDMYRTRFQSLDLVFSVGGFHHYHMLHMAQVLKPCLSTNKLTPKYITIGTLAGNPLLQHQEIKSVVAKSIEALDGVRALYPDPSIRFIVYGLPPVVATYATLHSLTVETALYKWVVNDANAVFIPMFKSFAGKFDIYPKTYGTADGVHLSPVGMVLLDERFEVAKTAIPRTIVDYCE